MPVLMVPLARDLAQMALFNVLPLPIKRRIYSRRMQRLRAAC